MTYCTFFGRNFEEFAENPKIGKIIATYSKSDLSPVQKERFFSKLKNDTGLSFYSKESLETQLWNMGGKNFAAKYMIEVPNFVEILDGLMPSLDNEDEIATQLPVYKKTAIGARGAVDAIKFFDRTATVGQVKVVAGDGRNLDDISLQIKPAATILLSHYGLVADFLLEEIERASSLVDFNTILRDTYILAADALIRARFNSLILGASAAGLGVDSAVAKVKKYNQGVATGLANSTAITPTALPADVIAAFAPTGATTTDVGRVATALEPFIKLIMDAYSVAGTNFGQNLPLGDFALYVPGSMWNALKTRMGNTNGQTIYDLLTSYTFNLGGSTRRLRIINGGAGLEVAGASNNKRVILGIFNNSIYNIVYTNIVNTNPQERLLGYVLAYRSYWSDTNIFRPEYIKYYDYT